MKNICQHTAASENVLIKLRKIKNCLEVFWCYIIKTEFFNIKIKNKWKCLFLLHGWFPLEVVQYLFISYHIQYFFDVVRNKFQTVNIYWVNQKKIKSLRKEYVISERALNFDLRKAISENYKPMRVGLWVVYKFTENYCRLRLFSVFI